jgi:hypothetical protein
MRQDLLTDWIYKNLKGGVCPLHNDWFEPNGTGPEPDGTLLNRMLRWALRQMPADEIIRKIAAAVHDWRCHIGKHPSNLTFDETTAEFKKLVKENVGQWVSSVSWWRRGLRKTAYFILLRFQDEVYAWAVGSTDAGRKAYDSNSCVIEGG